MAPLKVIQSFALELLFLTRSSDHMHFRPGSIRIRVPIKADHGSNSSIYLALQHMAGGLNLASLITTLHSANYPTLLVDLPEFFQNRIFHRLTDDLHARRSGQRIHHVLEYSAFL